LMSVYQIEAPLNVFMVSGCAETEHSILFQAKI
jgi:hypothetical protein